MSSVDWWLSCVLDVTFLRELSSTRHIGSFNRWGRSLGWAHTSQSIPASVPNISTCPPRQFFNHLPVLVFQLLFYFILASLYFLFRVQPCFLKFSPRCKKKKRRLHVCAHFHLMNFIFFKHLYLLEKMCVFVCERDWVLDTSLFFMFACKLIFQIQYKLSSIDSICGIMLNTIENIF